ncbi:membrane protein [Streptomyces purpurascens]
MERVPVTKFLLSLHVLAAIVAIGPVTVAASMFPPAARRAAAALGEAPDPSAVGTVALLHRICRVYSGVGLTVPVLGFATGAAMGVLGSGWLVTSIALTAAAAGVLAAFVLPRQEELLDRLKGEQAVDHQNTVQLAMFTGIFNLLWATVTVLMIVRPGSTTGA